ncbi:hypothetical protein L3V77_03315 [Vibrio sp. DW001]|uniref:hypothetical protein n=1 Tax=Vibrio sp. DW001 TaxID=2912315 RepID=UPI0023AEB3BA|nr:hypothetical protein [Vibrio sp. DW001]WED27279.1 hypothetical protein L3V77_03315 [Vibrio sp. DW001]
MKLIRTAIILALFPLASHASDMTTGKAVEALNLSELALTYSQEKIVKVTGISDATQADALLIDMNVIKPSDLGQTKTLSDKLNHFVEDQIDQSERYIGNVSDKNIVERVSKTWNNSTVIDDKKTLSLLNSFIDNGLTTGYNVVDTLDESNFNQSMMIRYGHNNIQHAIQLLYLMKSEGFDPKVQLTPKSSAFLYLPEWGEPTYPVTTLESGKMVSVVKEYNLDFEFQTQERKESFMDLINQYAKKDSADEKGLLFESWWQPFYRSYTEMADYKVLTENRVIIDHYQADLMSLPEKAKDQEKQVRAMAENYDVVATKVWVNPSFYRYMLGEFK